MKKIVLVLIISFLSANTIISCRETKDKTGVIEKEGEEDNGILEKAGKKADEEVNEVIDKTIDEIGDDQ
jgi:hypothetical protein